jgi:gas vesicle protein
MPLSVISSRARFIAAACAAAALLTACAKPEERAAETVKDAQAALDTVREQAAKHHPEQLATAIAGVANLDQKLLNKDYDGVAAAAPAVMQSLSKLEEESAAKQAAMAQAMTDAKAQWDDFSAQVPKLIDAAQARIATLQKSLTLPPGLDQDTFANGMAAFDAAKSDWTAATDAYGAENGAAALKLAASALASGKEAVQRLGAGSDGGAGP